MRRRPEKSSFPFQYPCAYSSTFNVLNWPALPKRSNHGDITMTSRKHIFTAGPAVLPAEVLEKLAVAVVDYNSNGQSVMELSHRSSEFAEIHDNAEQGLRNLLGLAAGDQALFLQGGASTQFSMVPMNLLDKQQSADYLITGAWSKKALKEARRIGTARAAASSEELAFRSICSSFDLDNNAQYVHYTSNNTIAGTQWAKTPEVGDHTLVCDASSDILSRPIDIEKHDLIYAGAQKNIGPAGVTLVIIREQLYSQLKSKNNDSLPIMLNYCTHGSKQSRYNTPPTFGIYAISLVCQWLESIGGLAAMAEINERKAAKIYSIIDNNDFYHGVAELGSRSKMNLCFTLKDDSLQGQFIEEAGAAGMVGLKGHRSVGGLRASLYNALPEESVDALAAFMTAFADKNSG
jgi:phosphoserine aminotransferase